MYKNLILPLLLRMDPEFAHNLAAFLLRTAAKIPPIRYGACKQFTVKSSRLEQTLFGLRFWNPMGLAAGMTKSGRELLGWWMFGFGFLEMGGITKDRQAGNKGTRMFRNVPARVLFNRMGFNNPGAYNTALFLCRSAPLECPLFINIGKSKSATNEKAAADYAETFETLYQYGDVFVLNPSSPNTPGLRELQGKVFLRGILAAVNEVRGRMREKGLGYKKVLVKLAPDLPPEGLKNALEAVFEEGANGVVAANTTITKLGVECPTTEMVGMSGPPLFELSLPMVAEIHKQLPELPIIAVGGIDSGEKMYQMAKKGASLGQLFTGIVYEGFGLTSRINLELDAILKKNGETMVSLNPKVKRI
ncbi:MAG: quinone-dependent dihydroorotate dehydrogenase [bacterium]|nr:quinone-dependent dihydroorotate dehydrogenase [bacterium]